MCRYIRCEPLQELKSMMTEQKHAKHIKTYSANTVTGSRLLQEMCPWYAGFKGSLVLFLAQILF